ncbi:hypothetical protein HRbin01_00740 [archaeon HR01]|nr:hypothetical protein HRbin01_00740 [archaeon HR01]
MVSCPVCGERVPYSLLRVETPRCSKGHELGLWVMCGNRESSHIYLRRGESSCPVCSDGGWKKVERGTPVKCLNMSGGRPCLYPSYLWLVDGPPCHLNHLSVIVVDDSRRT